MIMDRDRFCLIGEQLPYNSYSEEHISDAFWLKGKFYASYGNA